MGDEGNLLVRARGGDLDAFGDFVRAHERRVRTLLGRFLDDERDVDEAAQDVFVQAWRNIDRFRGDAQPFTWLYRIAVNEALQRTRRKRLETWPLDAELDGRPGDAESALDRRQLATFLAERLRALPEEFRAAVILRDVEGLSNAEVAQALGLTLPAAKARIHRGRMQLRAELAQWRDAGR